MLKQYYHVDEEGYILGTYVFDDSDIPPMYFEGWGEGIEEPRWDFEQGKWVETRPLEEKFEELKLQKFRELDAACEAAIVGYFKATVNGVEYDFSFDKEAQSNFTGIMTMFGAGMITEVQWTAWKDGKVNRIALDRDNFMAIVMAGFQHKDEKIARLRDVLEPKIAQCETIEELNNLTWDSEVPEPEEV
jgi:hypothetical protein